MRVCLMIEGQEGVSWEQWVALAQACEESGLEDPNGNVLTAGRKYDLTYDQTGALTSQVDNGPTSSSGDDIRTSIAYFPTGLPQTMTLERGDGLGGWRLRQSSENLDDSRYCLLRT